MSARVILALGSNQGERAGILANAVADLVDHPRVRLREVSPVVQTKAVGGLEQPDYLNMVIEVETDLEPYPLLAHCQAVEEKHHRRRTVRWGPRTLDVDMIVYGDLISDAADLTLPHPRAHERAFVLAPWAWMDSTAVLAGRPVAELAAEAKDLADLQPYEEAV